MSEQTPWPGGLVVRPHLLQRLEGQPSAVLILVVAPAGYGKTTLLSEWLEAEAARAPGPVVRYALTEADNDPAHLLAGLQAAAHAALPDPKALPAVDETQASLSYPLAVIFQQAAALTGHGWRVVLDDYHLITQPAIHQALDTLLNLPTWPVQLVVASRTLPPLTAIARLRIEGRLVELDEHDLRFTPGETGALFAASGRPLKEAELRLVTLRTEGWAAALRLVCQAALRGERGELGALLDHMADDGHLFDYLAGQVLSRQPAEIRQFLRRTALLPYLEPELCNAYLGQGDARAMLDALERDHLFLFRLPDEPRRYRYHALFAAFLARCLEQEEGAQAVRAWHRRAAHCFLARSAAPGAAPQLDEHLAAVRHLLAAQDWEAAADAIENVARRLDLGQITLMEGWFNRLPPGVVAARPRLLMALGLLRAQQYRWSEALETLAQAGRGLGAGGELWERMHILRRQGWIHFRQGRYAQAREFCLQALALAPADKIQGPPVLLQELAAVNNLLGACYTETDDIDQGYAYKLRSLEMYQAAGDRLGQAKGLHNIAMNVYFPQGRLAEAAEFEQRALRIYDDLGSHLACGALSGLGYVHLARGDYEAARTVVERLLTLADAHRDTFQRGYALTQLGHVHREQGRGQMALACYEEACALGEELHEPNLLFEPRQGLALLALEQDNPSEALRQAETALRQTQAVGYRYCEGLALITLGLVMDRRGDTPLAEARYAEAIRLLQQLGAQFDLAIVYLYLADLYRRDGREADALTQLENSLALSRRCGYDFLFTVRERRRALPLLAAALTQERAAAEEAARLLRSLGQEAAEPLLALLADDGVGLPAQLRLIQLLGEVGDERAVPALDRLRRRRACKPVAEAALQRIAERPAPPLRILALGGFQVWRGSALVPPEAWQQRRKARLLLLYLLAQRRRAVPRDELLEVLWPDLAPESARLALNTTFSDLRKLLEPYLRKGQSSRYLTRENEGYAFDTHSDAWYDVQLFEQAVRQGGEAARHQLELYRGDFLPEEPYADWVVRERERLRSLYLNTLTRLLEQQTRQGAWREAIDLARHILEREPWLEEVWLSLMTCYVALGRRSEALQAYQACERSLRQELDVAPSAKTRALYEQLKA